MKVLITREIPRAGIEILRKHGLELDYRKGAPLSEEELKTAIADVDAIIPVIPDKINEDVINAAGENLKVIATYSVGFDHIDLEAAKAKNVYVSNTPGDLTEAVAEHSMALLMTVGRQIIRADKFVTEGKYEYWDPMIFLGEKFTEKTLGLVGLGRIGSHFAKIAKGGFNMRILYNDIKRNEDVERELGALHVSLDDLFEQSDFISIHVPLLPSTQHLITSREFKKMKPTAYIINTARGPIIDEDALVLALKENWIAGAGIDVYEEEPKINPQLKELDNVVLTPHIGSATREARIEMARMAAENVIEVLINKKPPINEVKK